MMFGRWTFSQLATDGTANNTTPKSTINFFIAFYSFAIVYQDIQESTMYRSVLN